MGQRPDQAVGGAGQHAGVGVQRDHIAEPTAQGLAGSALHAEGGGPAQQQTVQVHQRAALAVPAHVAPVGPEQRPGPVQIVILLHARATVHLGNPVPNPPHDGVVPGQLGAVGVGEIAQQQAGQVGVLLETAQRLQPVAGGVGLFHAGQQNRRDDQRAPAVGQAIELQLQQPRRAVEPREHAVDQRARGVPRGKNTGGQQPGRVKPPVQQYRKRNGQHERRAHAAKTPGIGDDSMQTRPRMAHAPKQRGTARVVIQPPAAAPFRADVVERLKNGPF